MPGTVRLHRVLTAPPEKVYRAFLDADAKARWLPPDGYTGRVHRMDARPGGGYEMSFTNFTTGRSHSFRGTFLDLVPHERLRYTDRFDDPAFPGELQVTVTLKAITTCFAGTDLSILQEGIPDEIPIESCYLGWQQSLDALARLTAPHIPD